MISNFQKLSAKESGEKIRQLFIENPQAQQVFMEFLMLLKKQTA